MSSIFGHALIGAAIGNNVESKSAAEKLTLCLFYVALSIAPDLDYLPTWLLGLNMEPRYSHSLGGCFLISALGLIFAKYCLHRLLTGLSTALIFASPLSHIFLDFMVGVHENPIFWPFINATYASSYGALPSAGRLSIANLYLWRNLAIEIGILFPLALLISATGRRVARKHTAVFVVALASFLLFGYVAHDLHR